jgi:protein gp37
MATQSSIEWTEMTWNPVTGCSKISAGCKYCYAERMAMRLHAMGVSRYQNKFEVTLQHDLLDAPMHWRTPRVVFVNSMSDLFHEKVPLDFIKSVFATMNSCTQHIFQVLTKRSERLRVVASELNWTENIWMGVSVEDERVVKRIDDLRRVPANVRFLSCEPLIGPLHELNLEKIHWVIVGGESGPSSRPMEAHWVKDIHKQCKAQKVAFFFKQWGGTRKDLSGRLLDNKTYDEYPRKALSHPALAR